VSPSQSGRALQNQPPPRYRYRSRRLANPGAAHLGAVSACIPSCSNRFEVRRSMFERRSHDLGVWSVRTTTVEYKTVFSMYGWYPSVDISKSQVDKPDGREKREPVADQTHRASGKGVRDTGLEGRPVRARGRNCRPKVGPDAREYAVWARFVSREMSAIYGRTWKISEKQVKGRESLRFAPGAAQSDPTLAKIAKGWPPRKFVVVLG
jgi:hypothetical protein